MPKPRQGDMRWLMLRGHTYYAVKEVPRSLQPKLGRRLMKTLKTTDLRLAVAKRHEALAEIERIFDRARGTTLPDTVMGAALSWRETIQRLERGDTAAFAVSGPDGKVTDPGELLGYAEGLIDEATWDIKHEHGREKAAAFAGIARGSATPLLLHVDAWIREGGKSGPLNPRTATMYRHDVTAFAEWGRRAGVVTVEAVTAAVAGRYVTEELVARGIHPKTGNRRISAISAYWKWLRRRTGCTADPWIRQSLAKGAGTSERSKRPFTEAEMLALLAGDADSEMADAIRVAALTGMRIEEIYRLTIADCAGGWFRLRQAKTKAGVRRVPIHSDLAAIVARRCAGKVSDAFLMHEAGSKRDGRERSMAASKRFGHYRQRLKIHEKAEGARQSRVDFHSFRRWFITKARNAGIDRAVVAAVVGHEVGNLTDDTYSGGPSDDLLRACVEAVRLPRLPE